jgi:carbon monoxide dehydrogenase subunit G
MELMNEFEVDLSVEQAWDVLTDLSLLTPCVPGARLDQVDGDARRGLLAVKVGPIDAHYEGRGAFVELDREQRRIVLSVTGHDTEGQGDATASITLELDDRTTTTGVSVVADLSVTGKVAQFGRGVLAEVSNDLMDQFVSNLQAAVADTDGKSEPVTGSMVATAAAARGASQPGVRAPATGVDRSTGDDPAPSDPGDSRDSSTAVRLVAAAGAALAVVAFGYLLRQRGRKRRG